MMRAVRGAGWALRAIAVILGKGFLYLAFHLLAACAFFLRRAEPAA